MNEWHRILHKCVNYGKDRDDRTGVGTKALFGELLDFGITDLAFPAVTTKKLAFKQVVAELTCFLRGYSTLSEFHDVGCTIWDANAKATSGELGRIYGVQWRAWDDRIDQLDQLVKGLSTNPHSRRHLVTAWNPSDVPSMTLPPCHTMFQCFVDGKVLDILVSMRSVDLFLGLPFDVASYSILQHILAKQLDLIPGSLKFALGDAHVYNNHQDQVELVLSRRPKRKPWLLVEPDTTIDNFEPSMVKLANYEFWDAVPAEMNV